VISRQGAKQNLRERQPFAHGGSSHRVSYGSSLLLIYANTVTSARAYELASARRERSRSDEPQPARNRADSHEAAAAILHNAGFAASEPVPAARVGRSLASEQWRSHCAKRRIV
jgi:hypothetical protein